jgi:hypothetical protein
MKTKLERIVLALLVAPLAPIALFLAAWWGSYTWLPESWIPACALAGLLLGILVDAACLKRWMAIAPRFNSRIWIVIHLFYSMGLFGMFMGVPVFNAALALPAGFVVGGRLAGRNADAAQVRREARRTALFTTSVLALVCGFSAFIALASPSTASDLRGMLGLPFEVTPAMIVALIVSGGAALLAVNWFLTALSVRLAVRWLPGEAA